MSLGYLPDLSCWDSNQANRSKKLGFFDFERYPSLVNEHKLPFVRASGAPRVIDSAWNWTAGMALLLAICFYTYIPPLVRILASKPIPFASERISYHFGVGMSAQKPWSTCPRCLFRSLA